MAECSSEEPDELDELINSLFLVGPLLVLGIGTVGVVSVGLYFAGDRCVGLG